MTNYIFLSKEDFMIEQLQTLEVVKSGLIQIEEDHERFKCISTINDVMIFFRFGAESIKAIALKLLDEAKTIEAK